MAEQPQAVSNMFVKAFLPGLVLGVIVGMVVGMVVVPLFDRAPQIRPSGPGSHPVVTERDATPRSPEKPVEKPAEKTPETKTPGVEPTAPGSGTAPAKP